MAVLSPIRSVRIEGITPKQAFGEVFELALSTLPESPALQTLTLTLKQMRDLLRGCGMVTSIASLKGSVFSNIYGAKDAASVIMQFMRDSPKLHIVSIDPEYPASLEEASLLQPIGYNVVLWLTQSEIDEKKTVWSHRFDIFKDALTRRFGVYKLGVTYISFKSMEALRVKLCAKNVEECIGRYFVLSRTRHFANPIEALDSVK